MPALPKLLPILLLLSATQSTLAHLPSRLDAARLRSLHRRHHARRAEVDADASNAVGDVVQDLIDDVITPAILKAASMGSGSTSSSTFDSSPLMDTSDGEYLLSSSELVSVVSDTGNGESSNKIEVNNLAAAPAVATVCSQGDWLCDGMTLKQCNWNQWNTVRECSGDNIICSDQGSTVGCVWTWSVPAQQASTPSPATTPAVQATVQTPSSDSASTGSTSVNPILAIVPSPSTSSTSLAQASTATPTTSPASWLATSTGTSPVATSTWINDQGEECWETEWEEEVWVTETIMPTTSRSASSSYTPSSAQNAAAVSATMPPVVSYSSAAPSASASATASSWDDEDCEEWEDATSSSSSAGMSASQIGNNLAAGAKASSSSSHSSASPTASSSSGASNASPTPAPSPTSAGFNSQIAIAATISASNEVLSNLTNPSKTLSVINVSALSISSVSTTKPATQGVITATPSAIAGYSAPHYVVYSDMWLSAMPDVSTLGKINRFVLAFWLSDQGPADNAIMWTWMSQSDRQRTLDTYHAAGVALMVSAFGSTDQPTTMGKDPLTTAQQLAKFVVDYQFDGVDIDYEDMGAMNSDKAEAWLIPFQKELRRLLPRPYLISHAPVSPWFTSSNAYRSGAYVAIHQSAGDGIDFYNMQFYNQGDGVYTDCNTLINQSGGYWPGTSVMEMNSYAKVPLSKIVIGKPLDQGGAANGYMSPQDINTCVKQARGQGWNGGVMFWEWTTDAPRIMGIAMAS